MMSSKRVFPAVIFFVLMMTFFGCKKPVEPVENYEGKAHVDFKWRMHTDEHTKTGWIIGEGWVVNKGTLRAEWVKVTVYVKDEKTGAIMDSVSVYIEGSGPNGKNLEPGASARYRVRLNSKKEHNHVYEREVSWAETLQ